MKSKWYITLTSIDLNAPQDALGDIVAGGFDTREKALFELYKIVQDWITEGWEDDGMLDVGLIEVAYRMRKDNWVCNFFVHTY